MSFLPINTRASAATNFSYGGKVFSVKKVSSDILGFYVDNVQAYTLGVTSFEEYVKYDAMIESVDNISLTYSSNSNEYSIPTPQVTVNWTQYRDTGSVQLVAVQDINLLIRLTDGILTEPTLSKNGSVITIQYPIQATYKKYRVNKGAWKDYSSPITVSSGLIEAISGDSFGRVSSISNIYSAIVPPTIKLSASPSTATTRTVTVTATITSQNGISEKKYDFGTLNLDSNFAHTLQSNNQFQASLNGTYTVLVKDNDGNKSIERITINNIDSVSPQDPSITLSTESYAKEITVSINYTGTDVARKLYKIDNGEWIDYTTPITISKKCRIYAMSVDAVGNSASIVRNINNILEVKEYIYDKNGRITDLLTEKGNYKFIYDKNGNLLSIKKQ